VSGIGRLEVGPTACEHAEDLGGGLAGHLAFAGVVGVVGGEFVEAGPCGDLGLGLDDAQADGRDEVDVGKDGFELRGEYGVGELLDGDVVEVAEAEGVVVGVDKAGEELGEGGQGTLGRRRRRGGWELGGRGVVDAGAGGGLGLFGVHGGEGNRGLVGGQGERGA
jgi:hypothetical protein